MANADLQGFADRKALSVHSGSGGGRFALGVLHPDHGVNGPAGIDDDRHIFIVAGSRAGKGVSMIIPNLLSWQGGIVCIDPKGENASITAMRRGSASAAKGTGTSVRQFIGQKVAILDPMNTVKGPAKKYRVAYDPLHDVAVGSDDEGAQILAITESIVIAESGNESHWTESAGTILAGIIEAVVHLEPPERRTLAYCRKIYQQGMDKLPHYLRQLPETPAGLALDALTILEDAGAEEAGSFSTTLNRQLRFLTDPRMQRHMSAGSFSLTKAVRENWSVYICLPPSHISRMKRWLRLLVRTALEAKMTSSFDHEGVQSLFLLDEFHSLGNIKVIEDSAAYMAGYGIKLVPIIQNIGQIKELYRANWETFLGNAGAIIAWGLNDLETEKYISDRLGTVMVWEVSESYGTSKKPVEFFASSVSANKSAAL
ncbi:MAG: type IV secretory system conjugative DNA transfer family protein, partial [Halothiobacillus sp.]|nr:type IV secretory system conjugative DNA transfer family protein [Halothiobacillus sp.]